MAEPLSPCVRPLARCEPYEQDEPGIASFRRVLARDELAGLSMGLVTLEGPIHKTPGTHDEWDQVYLIFSGSATIHLAGRAHRVTEPSAVIIPRGTKHSVELLSGESVRYVYVNKWV